MSGEVGDRDQVGREVEDAVELGLCSGSPSRVESERPCEPGEDEPDGEDDPRQGFRGSVERLLWYDDVEALPRPSQRLADRFPAARVRGGGPADRELHAGRVHRRRTERRVRHEERHVPGAEDLVDQIWCRRDEEEPARPGYRAAGGGRGYTIDARRTLERSRHPRLAAQVDPGRGRWREAGDKRRRYVG